MGRCNSRIWNCINCVIEQLKTSSTTVNISTLDKSILSMVYYIWIESEQIALAKRVSISISINGGVACVTFVVYYISISFYARYVFFFVCVCVLCAPLNWIQCIGCAKKRIFCMQSVHIICDQEITARDRN